MALETRHIEKNMLFMLLKAQKESQDLANSDDFKAIVVQLMAQMEQEDVVVVEKRIGELT
jgi:hypothetical protein